MRHMKLRRFAPAVWLLLFLSLSIREALSMANLTVELNKSVILYFSGGHLTSFLKCICDARPDSCKLSIWLSNKHTSFYGKNTYETEVTQTQPGSNFDDTLNVFECLPCSISEGSTFFCGRKSKITTKCDGLIPNPIPKKPLISDFCGKCIALSWGVFGATYSGSPSAKVPKEGQCASTATEITNFSQEANSGGNKKDNSALGIGVGLSCAVLAVVAIVAVLVFYRKRRFKEKQKAEERRISYIQPSSTDGNGNDYTCDRGRGSLPPTGSCSSLDCPRNSNNNQPSSELINIYSSIPDEYFSVSNGESGMNTQSTPAYKLAKNGTTFNEEKKGADRIENNMDLGLEKYNVAAGTKPIQDRENQHRSNAENKQSGSTQVNEGNFYNVPSEVTESSDSHVYTSLDDAQLPHLETSNIRDRITNTKTSTLDKFNLAPAKDFQPKNVYNRLNDKAKQNDLKTFNKASGNKVKNENQQSNIYDRVKDPRAKSTPGTYRLAAGVKLDQQQQINNKLDKPTETLDRKMYHTASAADDQLKSIDQRVNDKTKTYDLAGENENKETSPYNRLHGEALTPDLDTYNTASRDKNGQSSPYNRLHSEALTQDLDTYNTASRDKNDQNAPYNRLNEKADMLDLGTYNKASGELHKPSLDFSMNKTSTGVAKSRDPYSLATTLKRDQKSSREDVNDYNEVELSRSLDQGQVLNGDSSQTVDNENDDSEDSNADYFTLEQE